MAELFQKNVRTINEHLVNIYDEGELAREATIRRFRIVRTEDLKGGLMREIKTAAPPHPKCISVTLWCSID